MVSISGFESHNITAFSLIKEVNAHSLCSFDVNIGDTDYSHFIDMVNKSISVNNGREYLFFGFITSVTVESKTMNEKILHICAYSHSAKIDCEKRKCLYQDPDKKLSDILKHIKKETGIQISSKSDTSIQEPIIQPDETDFKFLIRLASYTQRQLIVSDSESPDRISFYIGDYRTENTVRIEGFPDKLSIQSIISKHSTSKQTIAKFTMHDQYIDVGKRINLKYEEFTGYITRCEIILERNAIRYKYTAYNLGQMPEPPSLEIPPYIEMQAIVKDSQNPDGRCCIKANVVGEYADAMPDNTMWIPYQSPYLSGQAGAVLLPNKGDYVTLIFNNNKMTAQAYCADYLIDMNLRGKQNHYISSIFGKKIVFGEDSIEIHADKSTIVIGDDDITLSVGENAVNISEKAVKFTIKGSQIQIDRDITFKTDSFSIQGNDTTIKASGDVKIRGSKIYLK